MLQKKQKKEQIKEVAELISGIYDAYGKAMTNRLYGDEVTMSLRIHHETTRLTNTKQTY